MSNKLNTFQIGDDFETKSYEIIRKLIETEQLGILPQYVQVYQKKKYYSHLRKKDITFDLTIELWPPGAERFVMLYIIECKDFSSRVPVKQVEDFYSKIQQVAGVNVKGVFISNSPLQEAAYNIAESIGMMLIQAESAQDYKIILHRRTRAETNCIPIISDTLNSEIIDEGVTHLSNNLDQIILGGFIQAIENTVGYSMDRLSQDDISVLAEEELKKINPQILEKFYGLEVNELTKYLTDAYGILFEEIQSDSNLLGSCNLDSKTIGINESIKGTSRELFIIAHEFGHYLLHQRLTISQQAYDSFSDSSFNFRYGRNRLDNPRHWIEWQANSFASSLVLPKVPLYIMVKRFQKFHNLTEGIIPLTDEVESIENYRKLMKMLASHFNVSQTSVEYKLNDMKLIKVYSRLATVGQILSENREELCI